MFSQSNNRTIISKASSGFLFMACQSSSVLKVWYFLRTCKIQDIAMLFAAWLTKIFQIRKKATWNKIWRNETQLPKVLFPEVSHGTYLIFSAWMHIKWCPLGNLLKSQHTSNLVRMLHEISFFLIRIKYPDALKINRYIKYVASSDKIRHNGKLTSCSYKSCSNTSSQTPSKG